MYEKGWGVSRDFVLAHMWFSLAAAKDYVRAVKSQGRVATHMTPAQISWAKTLARAWPAKHGQ